MAPTETAILTNYLLIPAQLPAIITLKEFTELFPRIQQSSPHVRRLYRDLQTQRNALIDDVASNIEQEAKRGKVLRREALRANREAESQELDDELDIERAVCFDFLFLAQKPQHDQTFLTDYDTALRFNFRRIWPQAQHQVHYTRTGQRRGRVGCRNKAPRRGRGRAFAINQAHSRQHERSPLWQTFKHAVEQAGPGWPGNCTGNM